MARRFRNPALLGLAVALLVGCETQEEQTGYIIDEYSIGEIRPGVTDRDSVATLLGTPSAGATFDDSKTWYYVSRRSEQLAFLDPDIKEQQVVAVRFNDIGVVEEVKRYTLEDGKVIDPVDRITPTRGRELTVLEQLFGNLGRFNNNEQANPGRR
ncbi:MAG: outer membrane protein assembly factor BamE [Alphaproteobacteria bacterium]